jgi:trk system potassium uptake protein TrkH
MEVNNAARVIMIVFMFLGGTNFYLHFKAIYLRKPGVYGQSSEFMGVLVWCIAMSIVMYFLVEPYSEVSPIETYLDSVFAVISSSTTTGYTLPEMDTWPKLSMIIMFAIAFVGASSGSTSGGVKMSRMIVLLKYLRNTVDHVLHPNTVDEIYVDGSPVSRDYVRMCAVVVFMFMVTICVFVVIFMLSGVESVESIEVVLAMITSLGTVDVDIAAMSPFLKAMMVIMMWAGRLEILVALAILNPRVCVEQYRDVRHRMANRAAR